MSGRYDFLIIGGGINGLGIAADAAARGLSVLLAERGDFGGGTTSASSRLIHGGLRYLQYGELGLVRESLRERGLLVRQRPHLVRPIELLIPIYRGLPPPGWKVGAGLALYDLLARDPHFSRPARLAAGAVRKREPGLEPAGLTGGFTYPDAQVEFPERLCVELMRETIEAGGEARNHTGVIALDVREGRVSGARLRDALTGEEWDVEARVTVNAAGPWVDTVNRLLPEPPPPLIGGTWGTHLVLPARPAGPRGPLYTPAKRDGRPLFLLPWDGRLLVGTTDVPFEGDPDTLRIQAWEPEYLLAETNRLFPGCGYTETDIQITTVGIRPLPRSTHPAAAITRRHFLVDHARQHGLPGLVSVVGGKLTTYRSLAEETVDSVIAHYGPPQAVRRDGLRIADCRTRAIQKQASLEELRREAGGAVRVLGLPEGVGQRLVRVYGLRYPEVLEVAARAPQLARAFLPGSLALAAEVAHAVKREGARTVDDILRRRLMLLPAPPEAEEAVRGILAGLSGCV